MKLTRDAVTDAQWRAVDEGRVQVIHEDEAIFRVTGSGHLACIQGLVTCDVTGAGADAHLYGALLTNKGMIQATLRITRLEDQVLVAVPLVAAPTVAEVFASSLPPRLCRFDDITGRTVRMGSYGARSAAGMPFDEPIAPGRARRRDEGRQTAVAVGTVARGVPGHELYVIAREGPKAVPADAAGERPLAGAPELLESCRILAGIPSLGSEIDDKTLPQEVRLEELGAVSYTKGCYLGQETVARLHFRGHANRRLALLVFDDEPADPPIPVTQAGKPAGRMTSACWSPELDAWVAQAVLRREVEDGTTVEVHELAAVVRTQRWLREP